MIVRNSCSDNSLGNYSIDPGNHYNFSGTPVGAGAWDNFDF